MRTLNQDTLCRMEKYIKEYQTENGRSPSYRNIMHFMNMSSLNLVQRYQDVKIEIYTNAIMNRQKTIGDFLLKRVDLKFTDEIVDLVSLLEILDVGFNIEGVDYLSYKRAIELLALTYTDDNFRKVLAAIRYKYSTVVRLSELLNRKQIDNCCIEVFNDKE